MWIFWDTTTLGPFVKRLERLYPEMIRRRNNQGDIENANDQLNEMYGPCQAAQAHIERLKTTILPNMCGGIPSRSEPFEQCLSAMKDALNSG